MNIVYSSLNNKNKAHKEVYNMTNLYACYETNQAMTKTSWLFYYLRKINKTEYPDFKIWWEDMRKSGVLEIV